jgi:hypothetical protein
MGLLAEIENIITADPGKRGIGGLVIKGELARSAQSLLFARTVLIITGFCVKGAEIGETDGPPGAVVLGKALAAMHKQVVLITDEFSYDILTSAAAVYGLEAAVIKVPLQADADYFQDLLTRYQPSHVIAVERPGQAKDGRYYNMRAEDITELTARTDALVEIGKKQGVVTIGIGDGGNELGMGKVFTRIQSQMRHGATIAACTATDYLIVAGVTNWGAYGLVAYLSALQGVDLLHDGVWEVKILEAMLLQGAVDGVTAKVCRNIDGMPVEEHGRLVDSLKAVVRQHLNQEVAAASAN